MRWTGGLERDGCYLLDGAACLGFSRRQQSSNSSKLLHHGLASGPVW